MTHLTQPAKRGGREPTSIIGNHREAGQAGRLASKAGWQAREWPACQRAKSWRQLLLLLLLLGQRWVRGVARPHRHDCRVRRESSKRPLLLLLLCRTATTLELAQERQAGGHPRLLLLLVLWEEPLYGVVAEAGPWPSWGGAQKRAVRAHTAAVSTTNAAAKQAPRHATAAHAAASAAAIQGWPCKALRRRTKAGWRPAHLLLLLLLGRQLVGRLVVGRLVCCMGRLRLRVRLVVVLVLLLV